MLAAKSQLVYRIRYSMRGLPYGVWEPEVARIPSHLVDCAVFMYPTARQARVGEASGGSGFLVGVPTEYRPDKLNWHLYAVTNSHVLRLGRSPVIRLNSIDGAFDVFETDAGAWVHHPDGDDVAACSITLPNVQRYSYVEVGRLVRSLDSVLPGAEAFMIGRCVGRDGKQRNTPTVRSGVISQLPGEPIRTDWGTEQEGFLVDMRSIEGYSGSPTFFFYRYTDIRPNRIDPRFLDFKPVDDWLLLGVNFAHIQRRERVYQEVDGAQNPTDFFVKGNTGFACIVPAWKVLDILGCEEFQATRRQADERKRGELEDGIAAPDGQ